MVIPRALNPGYVMIQQVADLQHKGRREQPHPCQPRRRRSYDGAEHDNVQETCRVGWRGQSPPCAKAPLLLLPLLLVLLLLVPVILPELLQLLLQNYHLVIITTITIRPQVAVVVHFLL